MTDANYTTQYLRSLVTEVKVYDALENSNEADDVLIAKTAYTFDDYAATGGMEGYGSAKPPSWDGAYGTTFTYRGNVTGVTQWIDIAAGTTLPTRLRKYDKFGNVLQEQVSCCKQKVFTYVRYDALGRMLYERIPEQSATINDGTGTYWTTKYTYTDFGAVATKRDARGVVATHSYDQMNRLTSVVYNISGAPGVAPGAGAGFTYDNNNGSPTNGLLLSAGNESYGYDSFKRLSSITRSIDGINYTTSYQYGAGNLRSRITYPSGRVVNINRSSTGRLTSLTDQYSANYLSGIGYNAAGQVTGLTLGNGVAETYGYDANRLQLTTQTATRSGGPQNGLMNLTYNYQAAAGQMGVGSTAGNAGQLMSISGTIDSTTESAAYSYDNLARLVTSEQTSNGSSAQRRFEFDRWGNRTAVWDAVSGGTKIQGVALHQSGGAPTNQIQSVGLLNYTYDSAGNVTNDGVHTYQYDGANRLVSVDGGSTAQYSYDQNNRRIKKVLGSATTHYVWEGSQIVSEHDGASVPLAEYIYSGSRMIAKVASASTQYFLSDRLSTRLVLDSTGNVVGRQGHLAFGEDFAESGTQEKHHFTSYERDAESGTDYAVNRGYNPSVGRFMSADPYRPSGYKVDPQSWNPYAYTRNNPVNRIDREGLQDGPPYPFQCTNCTVNINGGGGGTTNAVGGGMPGIFGGEPIVAELLGGNESAGESGGGDPGQNIWDLLSEFWNRLNRCEKLVALGQPFGALAAHEAELTATDVELNLRGGQPGDDDYPNAVKHCVWSCIMTVKLDLSAAYAFGTAHESDPKNDCNVYTDQHSLMDQHNNEVGRTIGYNLGFSGSAKECIKRCKASSDLQKQL